MSLVFEGKISSISITFLNFYLLNTRIMRNPDRYRAIARMLQDSFLEDSEHDARSKSVIQQLNEERKTWPEEIRPIIRKVDESITLLMLYHSPFLRSLKVAAVMTQRVLAHIVRHQFGTYTSAVRFIAKRDPAVRMLVRTKHELQELAA